MSVVEQESRARNSFPPLWKEVASVCNAAFQKFKRRPSNDLCKDYNKLISQICEAHGLVYDLTAYECSNYPALVRGSNSTPVVGESVESTQVLVVYYLLRELLKKQIANIKSTIQKDSILSYLDAYEKYTAGANVVKSIFTYLHWTWQKRGLPVEHIIQPTEIVVGHLWMDVVLTSELKEAFRAEVNEIVCRVRAGGPTSVSEMESVKRFSLNLGRSTDVRLTLYSSVIEETYLKSLASYYTTQRASFKTLGVVQYISQCVKAVKKEDILARCFLVRSSYEQVSAYVLRILIHDEKNYLLPFCKVCINPSGGNDPLSRKDSLTALYDLLGGGAEKSWMEDLLKETVSEYADGELRKTGDSSDASSILRILKMTQQTFETTVSGVFGQQPRLVRAVHDGIQATLAAHEQPVANGESAVRIAKRLARYAAEEVKTMSMEELRRPNNWVAVIYRLCSRQDVFHQSYTRFLQERLLTSMFRAGRQSEIAQREEGMLSSLLIKDRNFGFIFNCMRMLSDARRNDAKRAERAAQLSVKPYILTAFAWGESRRSPDKNVALIPPELHAVTALTVDTYALLRNGRRLLFSPEHSGARVKMVVPTSAVPLSLLVSLLQVRYLLAMNRMSEWSVEALCSCTRTSVEECKRALSPFVRTLLLQETGHQVFTLNPNLHATSSGEENTYDLRHFELESQQSNQEKNTFFLRGEKSHVLSIEGAVMRLLKGSGPQPLEVILGSVSASLARLSVQRRDIKKVLEKLVEREYVERLPDNCFSFIP
ncbi:Cullin family/Cullin protein neddylation domain containing protein [Novymonas esmeraldas]|uniref:Cullin family/Cullin protein neddylation domain containing protein n=1 Tax=Novymonas esmeraldas TaxID=1808958 RepID=A0AAW0EY33_9TRYP